MDQLRNILLLSLSIMTALLLSEGMLRLIDFPAQPLRPDKVEDEILVFRIPPGYPGVDSNGFRNSSVPRQAEIVALGDSHTYGLNADAEDSWPNQFHKLTGKSVYNMGIGGYGPLQYYHLFDQALSYKPRYIVVGLLLVNDIEGVCNPYKRSGYWKTRSLQEGIDLEYCENFDEGVNGRFRLKLDRKQKGLAGVGLVRISALIENAEELIRERLPADPDKFLVIDTPKNHVLISRKRLSAQRMAMDLERQEIYRSLLVTEEILGRMAKRAKAADSNLVVLIIPSRERVLHDYLRQEMYGLPDDYVAMVQNENKLVEHVGRFLTDAGIPHVDALNEVRNAVINEGNVYPRRDEGHPLARGYQAYSRALHDGYWVKRPKL